MDKQQIIDKLIAFRELEKFSDPAWEERGLIPSSRGVSEKPARVLNECTDELILSVNFGNRKQLEVLKDALKKLPRSDYDTEEAEFIVDYFFRLSTIVEVDMTDKLNRWLYGGVLNSLLKVAKLFSGKQKIVETLRQDCTKCSSKLETFIIKRQEGIPDSSWFIIQCNNCDEYNLLTKGPNIKEMKFGNYKLTEQLSKLEYDESEAKIRLNQIRFFRK